MPSYFRRFPSIPYDIAGKQFTNYETPTNIFFRLRIMREVLSNISTYYEYLIKDEETPEIIADKVYGDPESHWIILLANDIVDPQYDWPLNSRSFNNFIIDKYGSIATAKTQIHHYEKVIVRENQSEDTTTETRFVINQEKLTDNSLDVPYDYYEGTGSLAETAAVSTYNLGDGKTVIETISRDDITVYDWEYNLNEEKRNIKIIRPRYYSQIQSEFRTIMNDNPPFFRRLV